MKGMVRALAGYAALAVMAAGLRAQEWEHFRAAYPYHIQAIALSGQYADGSRKMVISEPPPSVTLAEIRGIDPALQDASTREHRLGVDGWVKDVVISLPPLRPGQLTSILNRLQLRLFGTAYKAYVMSIPDTATRPQLAKLNLHVTSGDLKTWIFGNTRKEDWGAIGFGFGIAIVLALVAIGCFAGKKLLWGLAMFGASIYLLFHVSALLAGALLALIGGLLSVWMLRKSAKKGAGAALAMASLGVLIFVGARWHALHRAPDTLFTPLLGGKALSCAAVLEQHRNGVFVSSKPGLVLWSFSKSTPLETDGVEIREFALDSDLVLGAVSTADQIGIVARERATPVAMLPPLRTETILQLAAAREDELAQSYERKNPFAGRYDRGKNMDWAPIYLSPRLIDTEYGSLLNITDQLLKGWTEHGEIEYVNFTYPNPPSYPFTKALSEELGAKELTFNWNTKGAGYVTKVGDYEVYALNQTGSLPIDYLAKGKPDVQKAEDTAYQYYSNMSDPNLIRVVQYAAIYQIFHHYKVVESANPKPAPEPVPSPLLDATKALLRDASEVTDEDISRIPSPENAQLLRSVRDDMRTLRRNDSDGSLQSALAWGLATRDGFPAIDGVSDKDAREFLFSLLDRLQDARSYFVSSDTRQFMLLKYALLTGARESQWIHTPSIVESKGTADAVGGHNLSARITSFEADETVAAGKVEVMDGESGRVIRYNPADDGRIGDTVRNAAREEGTSADQVRSLVEERLGNDTRGPVELKTALGFDDAIRPDPLRGFQPAHAPDSVKGIGWRRGGDALSGRDSKLLNRLGGKESRAVLVARDSEGGYVISAPPADPVQAYDFASSTDAFLAVTRDNPNLRVDVHFRGFDERQAEGFLRNIDEHSEVRLGVGSTEESFSPEELVDVLKGKYKWNEVTVTDEAKLVIAEDGKREIHAELSVPSNEAGKPSLVVRMKARIADAAEFTQQILAEFTERLKAVFVNASSDADARAVARMLVEDLKKDQRFASVKMQVKRDNKTIFYVKAHDLFEWKEALGFAS